MNPCQARLSTHAQQQRRALLPAVLLACLAAAATAQTAPAPSLAPPAASEPVEVLAQRLAQAEVERQVIIGDGAVFLGGMSPERTVKGAPYCADAHHETVQWLVDGQGGAPNRITRQNLTRLCRDGEGRTRQEVERDGRKLVYLRDPQSREHWVLDPEKKTARRMGSGPLDVDPSALRDFAERTREWARGSADRVRPGAVAPVPPVPPVPPVAPVPPTPVVITHVETIGGAQPGQEGRETRETREVRVIRRGGDGAPTIELGAAPPGVQWRAQVLAPRGPGVTTPLPARDIEGLRANGERTTWLIEAGKVGNDKPIQMTREVWTAPELMVTLQSRDFDPRSGEVNYRLKNLKRGEPDAALMRVPADFTRPAAPVRAPKPAAAGSTG